jgi:hypothetical protein
VLVEGRIDACEIEDAREVIRIASDSLEVIVLCNFHTVLLLHGISFAKPELSIMEGFLLNLLVRRLDLSDTKPAIFELLRPHMLFFFIFNHFNGHNWGFTGLASHGLAF